VKFNIENYEEVKDRLPKFFEKYPDGRVITYPVEHSADWSWVLFRAYLFCAAPEQERDLPLASGWAAETKGDGMVNKNAHIENCETSAIGRALANLTFHGDKRPSREEMEKVRRAESAPAKKSQSAESVPTEKSKPEPEGLRELVDSAKKNDHTEALASELKRLGCYIDGKGTDTRSSASYRS